MIEKLQSYVYGLFDPRDGMPFYIGKAGGKRATGNARVLDHFEEARSQIGQATVSDKVSRIHEIWEFGDVVWKILRSGLQTDEEALNVEATLIDTLQACGLKLCNAQGGHRVKRFGLLSSDDIYAWAAPKFDPNACSAELRGRAIFMFNIYKEVSRMKADGLTPNYVEATIRAWIVGRHYRLLPNAIAIGLVEGVSRCVVAIEGWKKFEGVSKKVLWEIVPCELSKAVSDELLNKSFSAVLRPCAGYMQRGGYPIISLPKNGQGLKFCRGYVGKFVPTNSGQATA
jgi:hypothetical protein